MKAFLLAALIWSVIVYVVNTYRISVARNDADSITEGVWVLFVPITGVIYGGITLTILKLIKWLRMTLK
jgi:hypothetical protein